MRLDFSQFPDRARDREWGISPLITFWASEFQRLRLQYNYTRRNFGTKRNINEAFLQWTFTLGPHRPEPF